jgi:hypothetical protein
LFRAGGDGRLMATRFTIDGIEDDAVDNERRNDMTDDMTPRAQAFRLLCGCCELQQDTSLGFGIEVDNALANFLKAPAANAKCIRRSWLMQGIAKLEHWRCKIRIAKKYNL